MKKLLLLLLSLYGFTLTAQFRCQDIKQSFKAVSATSINNNAKSDTIDIKHYNLYLDLTDVTTSKISGRAEIFLKPILNNVTSINLDLLELNVDSINLNLTNGVNNNYQNYTYNDTILKISFPSPLSTSDSGVIEIYYQGFPQTDGSGWGGFHAQSGYYYNLGVGFDANPHTFGRAWFPCFDNFVEKSTYQLEVLSKTPLLPLLSGDTIERINVGLDSVVSRSRLEQPIPTYLVSFALSNYQFLEDTVQGLQGTKNILLAAKAIDTSDLKASFQNLKPTLHAFEKFYGPYMWPRIGYALTTVGAMEHATSIHFPVSLVNGTLSGEDIMAHELAHHWWGNLVTCETAEDMWINEGMAEYSSHLYAEDVYGYEEYIDRVQDNAYNVLNEAHTRDNGYRPVYGPPHEYVYGYHVYQKGAMVAHNLRAYLGDNLFFSGLSQLLQQNLYGNLNTLEFRDQLSQITNVNLNDFFNDWILNPGFPQFSVDSLFVDPNSTQNQVDLILSQRLYEAPSLYSNVPVDVTFFNSIGDSVTQSFNINSSQQSFSANLPFKPEFAIANFSGKLLCATTWEEHLIDRNRTFNGNRSRLRVTSTNFTDTAQLYVGYHWAGPGGNIAGNGNYRISNLNYWTVRGIDLQNTGLRGRITYGINSPGSDLINSTGDSIFLLYRPYGNSKWSPYPYQNKTQISSNLGYIEFEIAQGDFVLGNIEPDFGTDDLIKNTGKIDIYPNPAHNKINILLKNFPGDSIDVTIIDLKGAIIYNNLVDNNKDEIILKISLDNLLSQSLIVKINNISYPITKLNH